VVLASPEPLQPRSEQSQAADYDAVFEHAVVFKVRPDRRAFEDQRGHDRCFPRHRGGSRTRHLGVPGGSPPLPLR
jgi:hypothetical protein